MKRDFNLIRDLLLFYESDCAIKRPAADEHTIGQHLCLLVEAGLLDGNISGGTTGMAHFASPRDGRFFENDGVEYLAFRVTWDGHDFLAATRDNDRWKSALKALSLKAGGMTLGMVKDYLELQAREKLGL